MAESARIPVPRISVVIPLYNKAPYIQGAIRSIQDQGELAAEIVVVDDGSTDNGASLVQAMAEGDGRVQLVRQANAGVSVARNRGIAQATGDYIAFLDADDHYLPGYLDEIARMIAHYPQAGMYATAYTRFSGDLNVWLDRHPPSVQQPGPILVEDFFFRWSRGAFFYTCSICVPRRHLLALGTIFPPGERLGEDQDVWFRLAERHGLAYSPKPLVLYRMEVANSLTAGALPTEVLPSFARLAERTRQPDYPSRHLAGARRLLASHYINISRARALQGNLAGAWALLKLPMAKRNGLYWLRTTVWLLGRRLWHMERLT